MSKVTTGTLNLCMRCGGLLKGRKRRDGTYAHTCRAKKRAPDAVSVGYDTGRQQITVRILNFEG